jgi:hypothetical protein
LRKLPVNGPAPPMARRDGALMARQALGARIFRLSQGCEKGKVNVDPESSFSPATCPMSRRDPNRRVREGADLLSYANRMETVMPDENPNPAEQMLDEVKKSVDEAISRTESAMANMGYDVSAASRVADDYRNRVFEYMRINMNAALDYANNLASIKWPADFMGLSAGKAREHGLSAPALTEISSATQAAEEYRSRMFQYMKANLNSMLEYAERLATVKSPTEFIELSNSFAHKQLETVTAQTTELGTLAQKLATCNTESLTGLSKVFSSPQS